MIDTMKKWKKRKVKKSKAKKRKQNKQWTTSTSKDSSKSPQQTAAKFVTQLVIELNRLYRIDNIVAKKIIKNESTITFSIIIRFNIDDGKKIH